MLKENVKETILTLSRSSDAIYIKVVQQVVHFIIPLLLCVCICAGSAGGYASGLSQAQAGTL